MTRRWISDEADRLEHVIVGAGIERFGAARFVVVAGQHDDVDRGAVQLLDVTDHFEAADARHSEIDDRDIRRREVRLCDRTRRIVAVTT